jgi:hypothetical protein
LTQTANEDNKLDSELGKKHACQTGACGELKGLIELATDQHATSKQARAKCTARRQGRCESEMANSTDFERLLAVEEGGENFVQSVTRLH